MTVIISRAQSRLDTGVGIFQSLDR